jgi:serine/threonine protein kinase
LQGPQPTFGDGRYLIRRELGRGTMGVVYEAEDSALARTVAVKTIDLAFAAGAAASIEFERRFFREARVAARLSHPGILVCHDVGKDAASGKLFIVFEYLKGRTLAARAAEGPMGWRDALGVVVQVARAIHHAHAHGVVHRDLKPANIMLLDPGTSGASAAGAEAVVKIMDFGVARFESLGPRLTKTGQSFGSPLYMSPEQALGQPSSARSDIFSLACAPSCRRPSTPCWPWRSPNARAIAMPPRPTWPTTSKTSSPGRPRDMPRAHTTRWPRCSMSRLRPSGRRHLARLAPLLPRGPRWEGKRPSSRPARRRWLVLAGASCWRLAAGDVSWHCSSVREPASLPSGPVVRRGLPRSRRAPVPRLQQHPQPCPIAPTTTVPTAPTTTTPRAANLRSR